MQHAKDWHEGSILRGYRLLRPIGEGGMGLIWEAEQGHLGRRVAIKLVAPRNQRRIDVKVRLLEEARLSALVEHANVVRIIDFQITEEGDPLLVMELLDGRSLTEEVHLHGPLLLRDARALLTQSCAALEAAHHAGILHLDVNADNIVLLRGSPVRVKLIDFGIARRKRVPEGSTSPSELDGSPQFMSPEQMASCDDVDERSDDFCLAVCLYHALTGAMPFVGTIVPELWVAISRGELKAASSFRHELVPQVDRFFARALA